MNAEICLEKSKTDYQTCDNKALPRIEKEISELKKILDYRSQIIEAISAETLFNKASQTTDLSVMVRYGEDPLLLVSQAQSSLRHLTLMPNIKVL